MSKIVSIPNIRTVLFKVYLLHILCIIFYDFASLIKLQERRLTCMGLRNILFLLFYPFYITTLLLLLFEHIWLYIILVQGIKQKILLFEESVHFFFFESRTKCCWIEVKASITKSTLDFQSASLLSSGALVFI